MIAIHQIVVVAVIANYLNRGKDVAASQRLSVLRDYRRFQIATSKSFVFGYIFEGESDGLRFFGHERNSGFTSEVSIGIPRGTFRPKEGNAKLPRKETMHSAHHFS